MSAGIPSSAAPSSGTVSSSLSSYAERKQGVFAWGTSDGSLSRSRSSESVDPVRRPGPSLLVRVWVIIRRQREERLEVIQRAHLQISELIPEADVFRRTIPGKKSLLNLVLRQRFMHLGSARRSTPTRCQGCGPRCAPHSPVPLHK